MQLETFRGTDLGHVIGEVRRTLGEDAMIVRTQTKKLQGTKVVEVIAARAEVVESFRRRIDGGRAAAQRAKAKAGPRIGPYVLALVGPPGAGKTTTAIKLALHPRGVGRRKVGLITLDTFRVGGVEEIQTFAEIAGLPVEIIYHRRELPAAMRRLRDRDVVLIDTPGRTTGPKGIRGEWASVVGEVAPDEVHLVLPASIRRDMAGVARESFAPLGLTHLLVSKLDQVPRDNGLAELTEAVGLPARWVTDGQDIPGDLHPANQRILASLGALETETHLRHTAG